MKRPEERRPRTIDPLAVAAAMIAVVSTAGGGAVWPLVIAVVFAVLFISAQIRAREPVILGADRVSAPPVAFFFIALASLLWEASPWALGGRHPLWSSINVAGAATVDLEAQWLGFLSLTGLALTFMTGFYVGQQTKTASSLALGVSTTGALLGILTIAAKLAGFDGVQVPLMNDPGVRGALFGAVAIVSADGALRGWREKRRSAAPNNTFKVRLAAAPISLSAFVITLIALLLTSTAPAIATTAVIIVLLLAWSALVGGRSNRVPRRVLLWLAPAGGLLATTIAILTAQRLAETASITVSRSAHWSAFWASPWSGYGLNSEGLVAKLFMTRLTASALTQNPVPPQTFLVWLEQGGVLAALPLIACIVWITGFILFASLRTGRSSSLMRMTVCVSLYFGLLGLTSAGPAALSMETLWALILGVGFGAAYLSR